MAHAVRGCNSTRPLIAVLTLAAPPPAYAATVTELEGAWAPDTPAEVQTGDAISAQWWLNLNDDDPAPGNEPAPTVDGYTITDTLPLGATYVPGSATPEPQTGSSGGSQTLTGVLNGVATNEEHTLDYQLAFDCRVSSSSGQDCMGAYVVTTTAAVRIGFDVRWRSTVSDRVQ